MNNDKKSPAEAKPDLILWDANISQESFKDAENLKSSFIDSKFTAKLSNRQTKVLNLLKTRKCSAADISVALHYSDPRSYIRELRDKGINVLDEWVSKDDVRYKRYWIEDEED